MAVMASGVEDNIAAIALTHEGNMRQGVRQVDAAIA